MALEQQSRLGVAIAVWTALWFYRLSAKDPWATSDLVLLVLSEAFLANYVEPEAFYRYALTCSLHLPVILCLRQLFTPAAPGVVETDVGSLDDSRKPWARPTVIPARTNHIRFHPEKHQFSYSYLLVGIPVGWRGRSGPWLSVDCKKRALLSVSAADHLYRDGRPDNLRAKLDTYLMSLNLRCADFPFAYLVTAPRVLGYSFNPVSFWYLYSADRTLRAMILEVNNTFDERRMYLMEKESIDSESDASRFSSSWAKDFHVSPFNNTDGSYSLSSHEPGLACSDMLQLVANTITLMDAGKKAKIVARVFSTYSPMDATTLSLREAFWLFSRYGWVGFLTFPRILREAGTLFWKKGLRVWFRPEVAQGSISRRPTETERVIETVFRRHLTALVDNQEDTVGLDYKPGPGMSHQGPVKSMPESSTIKDREAVPLTFEVLSPSFYSRLVHYQNLGDAIYGEAFCTNRKNRTLHIARRELLDSILAKDQKVAHANSRLDRLSVLERLKWTILCRLRCKPPAHSFENDKSDDKYQTYMTQRTGAITPLDASAMQNPSDGWLYRRYVSRLFLATRYAGGFVQFIDLFDIMIRLTLTMIGIHYAFADVPATSGSISRHMTGAILLDLVHLWNFIN